MHLQKNIESLLHNKKAPYQGDSYINKTAHPRKCAVLFPYTSKVQKGGKIYEKKFVHVLYQNERNHTTWNYQEA